MTMSRVKISLCGLPECVARCKVCSKLRSAAYYRANKERVVARVGAWRTANQERFKAKQVEYRAANRDQRLAKAAEYRKTNAARIKASKAIYYLNNRARKSRRSAEYYRNNKERIDQRVKRWQSANKDVLRAIVQNRRARIKRSPGRLSPDIEARLLVLQRGRCACCKKPLGSNYHLDHIVPLLRGGANTDSNMQLLRAACNLQKSSKDPIAYMQQKGYLL